MASKVSESTVVNSTVDKVWEAVRDLDFKWSSLVSSSQGGDGKVGGIRTVSYKDGMKQTVKLVGLDDQKHTVTWDLVESEPAVPYLSCIHTIHLKRVTDTNQTFLEWTTDFSQDAGQEAVQDCRFKRLEAFKELKALFA